MTCGATRLAVAWYDVHYDDFVTRDLCCSTSPTLQLGWRCRLPLRRLDVPHHFVLLMLESVHQLGPGTFPDASPAFLIECCRVSFLYAVPAMPLTYVVLATIQYNLVHPLAPPDLLQRVDDLQPQLSALHGFGHGDVLDMPNKPGTSHKLALHDDRAASYDLWVS
jgi:hypothetical protein